MRTEEKKDKGKKEREEEETDKREMVSACREERIKRRRKIKKNYIEDLIW